MTEAEMSLEELLQKLGLQDYMENFQKEQIDMEALVRIVDLSYDRNFLGIIRTTVLEIEGMDNQKS